MDFVFWIIAIVLIVGIVWWLLNRNSSTNTGGSAPVRTDSGSAGGSAAASAEAAGTAGLPSAAGFGNAAEPTPPTTADDETERPTAASQQGFAAPHETDARPVFSAAPEVGGIDPQRETTAEEDAVSPQGTAAAPGAPADERATTVEEPLAPGQAEVSAEPVAPLEPTTPREDSAREDAGITGGTGETAARKAEDEWETQWSEASGSTPAASHRPASDAAAGSAASLNTNAPEVHGATQAAGPNSGYVHHAEYTDPHAPTLPGAETAAADALTMDDAAKDALVTPLTGDEAMAEPAAPTTGYEPAAEPLGHLAADQPYGAGSASPGPDGSGPADFDVKGDAGAMVYYEEGHPDYEQTTADVWFESAAHAEAAGFRAPRRTRL